MELRHLEQITAISRAGSFSGAARRLRISQPTLSKSIARLEAELSVQLFDRAAGPARPTVYGRFVVDHAEAILGSVADFTRELERWMTGEAGRLRIGVGPVTRLKPLQGLIRRASLQFPRLQIETRQEAGIAFVRSLSQGRYDIVFANYEAAASYDNLMRVKIFEDRLLTVVRPGHPALCDAPLSPSQLLRFPMATFGHTRSFNKWLGQRTPEEFNNLEAFISDDYELIKQRPIGTNFVARGPCFVFEPELSKGALVELPLTWVAQWECWMLTTEAHWRSPVVKAIAELAKAAAMSDGE